MPPQIVDLTRQIVFDGSPDAIVEKFRRVRAVAIAVQISGSFVVPWGAMMAAICLCTVIGLISGYYPAKKASKLDPVESLRYE